jgi:hypothetical protein
MKPAQQGANPWRFAIPSQLWIAGPIALENRAPPLSRPIHPRNADLSEGFVNGGNPATSRDCQLGKISTSTSISRFYPPLPTNNTACVSPRF